MSKASTGSQARGALAATAARAAARSASLGAASAAAQRADVFQRMHIEPAYKAVSAEIERHILNGDLPPGAPLPTEQVLCERFGVHRSTVREAIRQVEQEGLLQRREGRRLYVTLPGLYDLAPRATRLLLLQQVTFRELWNVAIALEPLAARLAAAHSDQGDLAQLDQNLAAAALLTRKVEACGKGAEAGRVADIAPASAGAEPGAAVTADDTALAALDVEFHALVGHASHNRALMLAREPVSLFYRPTLLEIHRRVPQSRARNLAAHRQILEALHRRDGAAAADWTHKHMVDFQRGFALAGLDMDAPIALSSPLSSYPAEAAAGPVPPLN